MDYDYRKYICRAIYNIREPHYESLLGTAIGLSSTEKWKLFWEDITLIINNQLNEESND